MSRTRRISGPHFEIERGSRGEWHARFKYRNGKKGFVDETRGRRRDALRAVARHVTRMCEALGLRVPETVLVLDVTRSRLHGDQIHVLIRVEEMAA